MLNITHHQGNTNQNHSEIPNHTCQNAKINNSGNDRCWWECGERGTLLHCWWECKLVQPLGKTVWRFLKKLKRELPYDPAIALVGIYPKDTNVVIQSGACTPMFIAAMSTIAKLWKEPRCPSTDEWVKKMNVSNSKNDIYIYIYDIYIKWNISHQKMKSCHLKWCGRN